MKPKHLIILFIFGIFLFLLPSFAEAACYMGCCDVSGDCRWFRDPAAGSGKVIGERLGFIGSVGEGGIDLVCGNSVCQDADGKCNLNKFSAGSNGESCIARDGAWHLSGCNYTECDKTGVWDYSQSQCVTCNGKVENLIIGNTSQVNNVCGTLPSGNSRCESACGAAAACDEVAVGGSGSCGTGKTCDSDCQCVIVDQCPSGDCCDTTSHPYQYRLST